MRTNIDIDDVLMAEAKVVTGLESKRAVVEEALRRMVTTHRRRQAIKDMSGLGWDDGLESIEQSRISDDR